MRKLRAIAMIGAGAAAATIVVTLTGTTTSSYEQAIAYTKTRPAFTPTRTVNVSSAGALKSAIENLRPGDLVRASTAFTVSSGSTDPLVIANRLSAPAVGGALLGTRHGLAALREQPFRAEDPPRDRP